MMPASVCTRTQSTLANSSVRKVSIEMIFTADFLPSGLAPARRPAEAGGLLFFEAAAFFGRDTPKINFPCNISQHVLSSATRQTTWQKRRAEEAGMAKRKSALELVRPDAGSVPSRRNRVNFFELAYQRIE